jgi:hypothetical protein
VTILTPAGGTFNEQKNRKIARKQREKPAPSVQIHQYEPFYAPQKAAVEKKRENV